MDYVTMEDLWSSSESGDQGGAGDNNGGHVGDTRYGGVMVTRRADLVLEGGLEAAGALDPVLQTETETETEREAEAETEAETEAEAPAAQPQQRIPVLVSTHTFTDPFDVLAEVSTAEYLRGRYGIPALHGVVR